MWHYVFSYYVADIFINAVMTLTIYDKCMHVFMQCCDVTFTDIARSTVTLGAGMEVALYPASGYKRLGWRG